MVYKGLSGWKALGFDSYQEFLLSEFWEEKRKWIIECSGSYCQKCQSTKKLNVHHLNYINLGNEGINDVIVLCNKCHQEEHDGSNS